MELSSYPRESKHWLELYVVMYMAITVRLREDAEGLIQPGRAYAA